MTINFDTTNGLPYEVIIKITLEMTPPDGRVVARFVTQQAIKASDGTTQLLAGTPQAHAVTVMPWQITDSFPIYNPMTGEDTGDAATFMQVWGLMYSALHHKRVEVLRQEAEAAAAAAAEQQEEPLV